MDSELRRLFHELADLPANDRERILTERAVAPDLRAELESLLEFDSLDRYNLTDCVSETAKDVLGSASSAAPRYCGPYRLLRRLGSGGMGSVYLAERTDGEIQQQVAIKLLRAEEHRAAWRERFLKERQLLASLHHTSIVQAIDAGHTEDSRPYLVMEYVEGVPIDVYAAKAGLRDQLTLFLRVCEAISYAHRHLVIHRDLKPTNILVDASGQPKVLDFGIAKLLDETEDPTQTVERLMTPNYASPEQLRGVVQSTATDVYSLGAVLYKLLTGRSPHETETHASQAIEVVAGTRDIPAPTRLNPGISTDLNYIAGKALRIEPEQRYASVEAFASDIRAFLESRPVQARSGDTWYRTRKFARRYWVPVSATAIVVAGLSAGLYVANRERMVAQQRFQQLRQLSTRVFDINKAILNVPGSARARQSLVSASLEYLEGLARDAHGDVDLRQELAEGYWRVGRIQGVPLELNLGDPARAEASLKWADGLIEGVLLSGTKDRRALYISAGIAHDLMILSQEAHRRGDALTYAHKAAGRLDAFLLRGPVTTAERDETAGPYANIALALINLHLYAEAVPYARRSIDLVQTAPAAQYHIAEGLSLLANALRYQGDLNGALKTITEARKIVEQAVYPTEIQRAINEYGVLLRQGLILGENGGINLGRPKEAAEPLQKALDLSEAMARKDPSDSVSRRHVGTAADELGNILREQDPRQALPIYELGIRRLAEIKTDPTARRGEALVLADSSLALLRLDRNSEARERIEKALTILKETKDYPAQQIQLDSVPYTVMSVLAENSAARADLREAVATYEELLRKVGASDAEPLADLRDAPRMSQLYAALARLYRYRGSISQAENLEARRSVLWSGWGHKLPNNPFILRQLQTARQP